MMRSNYWSCTKFADWLRGTAKPYAETMEGWDEWRTTAKIRHNFRFWLAEEGLDYIQNAIYFIPDRIYAVKYYINNRWISHTHALTAHSSLISKGQWCDLSHRFLPCLFSELVDFVEVELAWWHLVWEDKEKRKKYNAPWWRFGWWNMRLWRCPQAGLDNLAWQAGLIKDEQYTSKDDPEFGKPTEQAVKAKEILDLYTWWTEVYLKRPDPYEASGWSAYCNTSRTANGGSLSLSADKSPELRKMSDRALKALRKIEEAYEKEDEQMMIRLIKVRHSLWT